MINAYRNRVDRWLEGQDNEPTPPKPPKKQHPVLAAVLVILLLWGLAHVYSAEHSKNNPPAACQLLGGTWDIWHGWQCDLHMALSDARSAESITAHVNQKGFTDA